MRIAEAEPRLIAPDGIRVNLQAIAANADLVAFYNSCGYAIEERVSMSKHLARSAK